MILVSCEHSFPFRLRHPDLAFNTDDFTNYIFSGEISPKSMYELLTEKWGIDPYLANILIDFYGGHIYDVYEALLRLYRGKENFHMTVTSPGNKVLHNCTYGTHSQYITEPLVCFFIALLIQCRYSEYLGCKCQEVSCIPGRAHAFSFLAIKKSLGQTFDGFCFFRCQIVKVFMRTTF